MEKETSGEKGTNLLRDIADRLRVDAGLVATVEFPDCIVVPHRDPAQGAWWFGTMNPPTWAGDLMTDAGECVGYLDTGIPTESADAGAIAVGIATALLTGASK